MTPYYADELATIYHGDAALILPPLYEGLASFDAVITDPPYGVGFDYGTGHDDSPESYRDWLWPIIEDAERMVVPGGWVVVYQAAKHARRWSEWFPREWRLIALPKRFVQMLPTAPTWATDYALAWQVPGGVPYRHQPWMPNPNLDWYISTVPNFGLGRRSIPHPCPRPLESVRYLVGLFVPPGGSVLDPFLGSGTTLRAAKDLARNGVGIEIEEKWCALSVERLRQEGLRLEQPA